MIADELRAYNKVVDLLQNRVRCINQVVGVGSARVYKHRAEYRCEFLGSVIAEWRSCDLAAAQMAYSRVDVVSDAVWYCSRAGRLCAP